jgi:hypothetical protein
MVGISRKRLAGISSALAMASVLCLMLATAAAATGPVLHRVTAGGPDACEALGLKPGCDGNFSLVATEYADGSVKGQYTDRFANGNGFHAVIDCVSVVGNEAWVSGVIISGSFDGFDLTGLPVAARLADNGTSANDPADQISFSIIGDPTPCTDHAPYDLFDLPQGQVRVT